MTGGGPGVPARGGPLLRAVAGAAIISCSAILVTLADTGAATVTFYRCALALPVLGLLAWRERSRLGPAGRRVRLLAAGAGLLLGTDLVLWNHSIAAVGAGVATVLGNLQVLFVAIAAWGLLGERPPRSFLAALPAVLAGVVLVSGLADGGPSGRHAVAGIWYGLTASVTYAGFLLIVRQISGGVPAGRRFAGGPAGGELSAGGTSSDGPGAGASPGGGPAAAGAAAGGSSGGGSSLRIAGPLADATAGAALAAVVLGLTFGGFSLTLPWASLGWLALLSLSSQTIGWLLITSSLPRLPAAVSSLLLLLQPAGSLLLAAVILGEEPTLLQVAGAVLVCGGILAANGALPGLRARPAPAAPQPVAAEPARP